MNEFFSTLALAIVYRAALDLKSKKPHRVAEAKEWIEEEGIHWCQLLGVSEKDLSNWQVNNFELPGCSHRNWRY